MILSLEREPSIVRIEVSEQHLTAHLDDGRILSVPLSWYPRLLHGTPEERAHHEIGGGGFGVHWPDLDEDISVENLLSGHGSSEGERSLRRWLATRGLGK